VIAANDDGVWNEAGASLPIVLRPRFYQTLWFGGLCAISVIWAAAAGHGVRVRAAERGRAAHAFGNTNERFRALVEHSSDGIALLDRDGDSPTSARPAAASSARATPPDGRR